MTRGCFPARLWILAHGTPLVPLPRPLAGRTECREDALTSLGQAGQMGKGPLASENPSSTGPSPCQESATYKCVPSRFSQEWLSCGDPACPKEQYDCIQTCHAGRGIKERNRFPGLQATAANPGLGMTENLLTLQWKCKRKKNTKTNKQKRLKMKLQLIFTKHLSVLVAHLWMVENLASKLQRVQMPFSASVSFSLVAECTTRLHTLPVLLYFFLGSGPYFCLWS